mgnify:CR=1 FL=1
MEQHIIHLRETLTQRKQTEIIITKGRHSQKKLQHFIIPPEDH